MKKPVDVNKFVEENYIKYRSLLLGVAWKLTKNKEEAEDLVQEVWLKVTNCLKRGQYQDRGKLESWLLVILYHTFINSYRQQKRLPPLSLEEIVVELRDSANHQSGKVIEEIMISLSKDDCLLIDLDDEVVKMLQSLPSHYRDPFLLTSDGYTYREVAEILDIPHGTVMSRLYRARRKILVTNLKKEENNNEDKR